MTLNQSWSVERCFTGVPSDLSSDSSTKNSSTDRSSSSTQAPPIWMKQAIAKVMRKQKDWTSQDLAILFGVAAQNTAERFCREQVCGSSHCDGPSQCEIKDPGLLDVDLGYQRLCCQDNLEKSRWIECVPGIRQRWIESVFSGQAGGLLGSRQARRLMTSKKRPSVPENQKSNEINEGRCEADQSQVQPDLPTKLIQDLNKINEIEKYDSRRSIRANTAILSGPTTKVPLRVDSSAELNDETRLSFRLGELVSHGICVLGEVGQRYCDDLIHADLSDPKTYDPSFHFKELTKRSVLAIGSLGVSKFAASFGNQETNLELADQIPISEFLNKTRRAANQANSPYGQAQKHYLNVLIKRASAELAKYKNEQATLAGALGPFRQPMPLSLANIQTQRNRHKAALEPTLLDLVDKPELQELCRKIERFLEYPMLSKELKPEEVKVRCASGLTDLSREYKTHLEGLASQMAEKSRDPNLKGSFNWFYGEPGNGKTSGIQGLAACTEVPVCLIESAQIRAAMAAPLATSNHLGFDYSLSLNASDARPDKSGLADVLTSKIFDCMTINFFDESLKRPVANGIILFDDMDRVLEGASEADRQSVVEIFKNISDESNKKLWDPSGALGKTKGTTDGGDFKNGSVIDVSKIDFFVTSNSLPRYIRKEDPATLSRMTFYPVPYAKEDERRESIKNAVDLYLSKAAELNKSPTINHGLSSEVINRDCHAKLEEIVNYDLQHYENNGKRTGMRGLKKLTAAFLRDQGANLVQGKSCAEFDVVNQALNIGDYLKTTSDSLLEEEFEKIVRAFMAKYRPAISQLGEPRKIAYFDDLFRVLLEEDPASKEKAQVEKDSKQRSKNLGYAPSNADFKLNNLESKKTSFEAFKQEVIFATNFKEFSKEFKDGLRPKFKSRFSYLTEGGSDIAYNSLGSVATSILEKISNSAKTSSLPQKPASALLNKVVIVKKQDPADDIRVVDALAEFMGLPSCEIDHLSSIVKSKALKPSLKVKKRNSGLEIESQSDFDSDISFPETDFSSNKLIDDEFGSIFETDCWAQLKNQDYAAQGFIVINLNSNFSSSGRGSLKELVAKISKEINGSTPSSSYDLSKLSVFIVADPKSSEMVNQDSSLKNRIVKLELQPLTSKGRLAMAERLKSDLMSQLPGIIPTEQDEMLFEKIIELDQSKFQQAQGKLSVDPLRGSIIQWANDIQQRNENFFRTESPGLTDEKAAEDLIGRLLHLYENLNEESHKSANSSLKSVDRVSF